MEVYFFGCESRSNIGHYLYVRPFRDDWKKMQEISAVLGAHIDTGLLKKAGVPDRVGHGVYVQQGGYSIVSWWDRGGDSRGASNSAFIVKGDCSPQEVMRLGREAFPTITSRSKVTLPDGTQLS